MKNKKIIIAITILIITISISINFAYSFYNAKIKEENKTETLLKTKKLELVFNDTKEINVNRVFPGQKFTKTFNVTSNADDAIKYNIKVANVTNTYEMDLVYKLKKDGTYVTEESIFSKTDDYIYTNVVINPKEKHEYELEIEFLNRDYNQSIEGGYEFKGTVEIDFEEIKNILTENYKESNEIEYTNDSVTKEFEVKNVSATNKTEYNIKLANIKNTYNEELTYELKAENNEITTGIVPKSSNEYSYLKTGITLNSGEKNNYTLTIKNDAEGQPPSSNIEKKYSAKIVIDEEKVDLEKPTVNLTKKSATSNSITYQIKCNGATSKIAKYEVYQDDNLIKSDDYKDNLEYTYDKLSYKDYKFKVVCRNEYGIENGSETTGKPVELITPTYETEDSYKQEKEIEIKYEGYGTYLFKTTGKPVASTKVYKCLTEDNSAEFQCEETEANKDLEENTWYKTTETTKLTYKANGTIIAKIVDGVNAKIGENKEITNIDREKPIVTFETNGNNTYQKSQSTKVNVTDNLSGINEIKYQWTNSNIAPSKDTFINTFTSGEILTKSDGTGDYYLWILATDNAGNQIITSSNVFKIDNEKPSCAISGLPTNWTTSATLTVSGADSNSGISGYSWDGTNYSSTKTKSIIANGTYTAYVKDNAGNVNNCSATISKIDRTSPSTPSIKNSSNGNWTNSNINISLSSSDTESGIAKYQVKYSDSNNTWKDLSSNSDSWSANRNETVYYRAVDNAGNVSGAASTVIKIDKTTPSLSMRSGRFEIDSTTSIVSSVSYGSSGGSVSCIDKSLSNKSVSTVNNLGALGNHTISCTARSNSGMTKTASESITIQKTYTGNQLNAGGAAYISGTSMYLPPNNSNVPHQFGPYVSALAGKYHVVYFGNNLNICSTTDYNTAVNNKCDRYYAYYNKGQSWLSIQSLNFLSSDSNYYITLGSNISDLEVNIENWSTSSTTRIDKLLIEPC